MFALRFAGTGPTHRTTDSTLADLNGVEAIGHPAMVLTAAGIRFVEVRQHASDDVLIGHRVEPTPVEPGRAPQGLGDQAGSLVEADRLPTVEGVAQLTGRVDEEVTGQGDRLDVEPRPPADLDPNDAQRDRETAPGVHDPVQERVVRVVVVVDVAPETLGDGDDPPQREMRRAVDSLGHRLQSGKIRLGIEMRIGETGELESCCRQPPGATVLDHSFGICGYRLAHPGQSTGRAGLETETVEELGAGLPVRFDPNMKIQMDAAAEQLLQIEARLGAG